MSRGLDALVAAFIRDGFVVLPGAFAPPPEAAARAARLWPRQPPDAQVLPAENNYAFAELAPAVWELARRLVGGRERLADEREAFWSDGFVVNPPLGQRRWPAHEWHVDGAPGSARRVDSPDPGLLVYSYWSDVAPSEGGTLFLRGSVAPLARWLSANPGRRKEDIPFHALSKECGPVFEWTGPAGSVLLAHPLLLHRPSPNGGKRLRLLSVRSLALARPLVLDRSREEDHSPVELHTRAALGLKPRRGVASLTPMQRATRADFAAADRAIKEGRHEEAVRLLDAVIAAEPADAEALQRRAEAHRSRGRHDLALQDLETLCLLAPDDVTRLCARGEGKRHLLDLDGAAADAEAALALDAGNASACVLLSETRRCQGRGADAVAAATRAIAADPKWSWTHVVRAKAKRYAGDLKGALEDTAVALKASPRDPAYALGWRGEILRKLGKHKEAAAALDKAVKARPHIAWMRALRGEARRAAGKAAAGLEDVLDAVSTDANLSHAYDFLGAEPASVTADPALAWVYAWRGGWRRGRGDAAGGRADLDKALALDPGLAWARAWRGELRLRSGDAAGALEDLSMAAKALPAYADGRVWLGQARLESGDAKNALKDFDAAAKAKPRFALAQVGRAVALEALGKGMEAGKAIAKAYALDPRLKEAAGS